jgi:putative flippase GtrA|tara:strand:- start:475 stop:960 length:486 start_codon:yes stop_codon:yes gene_type:complete
MNLLDIKTLLNCWKVGIFTTILDLVIFSILQQTNIDLSKQLYISIGITTFVGFFLQKYWAFKNENKGNKLAKQIIFYAIWQITFVYIITQIVVYTSDKLNKYLLTLDTEDLKEYKFLNKFLIIKDNKLVLNTVSSIVIKHIVIFIIFTFISVPMYTIIFRK